MGTFGRMWQDLYWIDLLSLLAVRRHRPWDRIDVVWFLLRLSCKPVVATEVLVLGGSVTGGGGVGNDPSRAWHSMLNNVTPTVHYKGDAPCRVSVTTMTDKRVRIDGMYVQEPSEAYLTGSTLRAPQPVAAQRQFEKNALKTGGACHANSSTG